MFRPGYAWASVHMPRPKHRRKHPVYSAVMSVRRSKTYSQLLNSKVFIADLKRKATCHYCVEPLIVLRKKWRSTSDRLAQNALLQLTYLTKTNPIKWGIIFSHPTTSKRVCGCAWSICTSASTMCVCIRVNVQAGVYMRIIQSVKLRIILKHVLVNSGTYSPQHMAIKYTYIVVDPSISKEVKGA